MNKISLAFALVFFIALSFTGCIKRSFDDG